MRQINVLEGKVVAPEGMKVGIVASRFNEIIVNKLLGGAVDGYREHLRFRQQLLKWRHPESMMR